MKQKKEMALPRRVVLLGFCAATAMTLPAAAWAGSFECLIVPNQTVEIRSPTEGVIETIHVRRGDRVKEGQALIMLESSVQRSAAEMAKYRAQMEGRITASKNRYELAVKKLKRAQELQEKNFVSVQSVDDAEAEKRIGEAELQDAVENQGLARHDYLHSLDLLNQRILKSPFRGVVVDRLLNPGDLAETGTGRKPILKLAQIDPLLVEVSLPLEAYRKVRVGMTGTVIPEGKMGRYQAQVTVVDSVFDAASGTFGVRLEMKNTNGSIPAGIRCQVDFAALAGGVKPQ